jgi:hypothetical protein
MFTPAQQTATENYNETILIPILHKKVNQLTADNILLEAQVQILEKEKKVLEEKLNSQPVPQVEVLNTPA